MNRRFLEFALAVDVVVLVLLFRELVVESLVPIGLSVVVEVHRFQCHDLTTLIPLLHNRFSICLIQGTALQLEHGLSELHYQQRIDLRMSRRGLRTVEYLRLHLHLR